MHLTLRAHGEVTSLRAPRVYAALLDAVTGAQRDDFRVVHYSAQQDHLHLIVEAHDGAALASGARGLIVRIARAVNRAVGRRGALWADRYYRRDLATPREVHSALAYVLSNARKHDAGRPPFDACSSAAAFDGWRIQPAAAKEARVTHARPTTTTTEGPVPTAGLAPTVGLAPTAGLAPTVGLAPTAGLAPPVRAPRTWLLRAGWKRHGPLDPAHAPGTRESWRRVASRRGWFLLTAGPDAEPRRR